jgi:cystathionine beta-lyase family protein involved in aluminum resistance
VGQGSGLTRAASLIMMEKTEIKADEIHKALLTRFFEIGKIVEKNQERVLRAFRQQQISEFHFQASTGYGYDDIGREALERIYADVFGGEAALVRNQFVSGTHAISTALYGVLRPGDELMYITGRPYDTLEEIIGLRGRSGSGSLKEYNISYREVELQHGLIDTETVLKSVRAETKVLGIQRSCGYDNRPSVNISEIRRAVEAIKSVYPDMIIFVDNCYGEFVETEEPPHCGADLTAGSLIKNPGGGLAKTGGYIVGDSSLIEQCSFRLTAPGIGAEGGASLGLLRDMYQGFFMAPHTVGEALKGAVFTSAYLGAQGMETSPTPEDARTDLIQSVSFPTKESMIAFCQAVQSWSPVDSHVKPHPSPMPGYESDVIMAAGAFTQGASIELSADGPLREPYRAYVQGGLTFEHVKTAVVNAVKQLEENRMLGNKL